MIKAVMFDAGDVLHTSSASQRDDLKSELGLTDEQLDKFYSHYLPLLGKGVLSENDLWRELRQDFGIREVSIDEHLLTRIFEKTVTKMPGMYELVDELKAKGMVVMLVTNVSMQFAEILEQKGHYKPFELKVLSFEVGSWKPEAKIYEQALSNAGIKPEEAIFVDDQKENVNAAKALGIHGIVFHNIEQLKTKLAELLK